MSFTFEPGVRLRSRGDFVAVQDRGRRVTSRYLTLLSLPTVRGVDRLGIIASRRLGGAVVRNRAKRRLRDIFRRSQRPAGPPNSPALDFVVIPRRELVTAPFSIIQSEFRRAIDRSRTVTPS